MINHDASIDAALNVAKQGIFWMIDRGFEEFRRTNGDKFVFTYMLAESIWFYQELEKGKFWISELEE